MLSILFNFICLLKKEVRCAHLLQCLCSILAGKHNYGVIFTTQIPPCLMQKVSRCTWEMILLQTLDLPRVFTIHKERESKRRAGKRMYACAYAAAGRAWVGKKIPRPSNATRSDHCTLPSTLQKQPASSVSLLSLSLF